ncbi:tyrosine-protein phosphatase [Neobacillus massiliamazoniensis]|uniref:Protein tyrosine/serine phosphatase n=1 Tax=Neobacillus massiliamazoniensis TaxID=1499688 RepID=A0A0U1NYT8_9BACI|nr:tyrosine-protein phosphatase [Neobacillus massiliamazoniensis]CRK83163.1 protein tyrosine/serine phosphatase [Neobacillus massiliamazoniensis]
MEISTANRYATYPTNRVVPFIGANNFRDMGGYKTSDGRTVKFGLFFRSDGLTGLTDEDMNFFKTLNIKYIIDYRDESEAQKNPDPILSNVTYERIQTIEQNNQFDTFEEMARSNFFKNLSLDYMTELYSKLPLNNPAYKRLMQIIQDPNNLGLLHHCTFGKDRTGVGAALILSALGVPKNTVMEDYLLTKETMKEFTEKVFQQISAHFDDRGLQIIENIIGIKEEFLETAFQSITNTYGNIDAYFAHEFGLTKEKRQALQSFCLE